MIFIALGTQKFQFNRLLCLIDRLIEENSIKEKVFAQIGNSDYIPQNYDYVKFLDKTEFDNRIKQCDILITHSGVATIIAGLKHEKRVIVVPRLSKFGEHVDDHQVQIAKSFSKQNLVLSCFEKDDFAELIKEARQHEFARYVSQRKQMLEAIHNFLNNL